VLSNSTVTNVDAVAHGCRQIRPGEEEATIAGDCHCSALILAANARTVGPAVIDPDPTHIIG
jgi:hypothetical protein